MNDRAPPSAGRSPSGTKGCVTDDSFLRLAGIHKSFGKFEALKNIALDVARGELMVFLGPSGCGKTTLLRIIAGLETQDDGSIVQAGRDISRLPAMQRSSPTRCFPTSRSSPTSRTDWSTGARRATRSPNALPSF